MPNILAAVPVLLIVLAFPLLLGLVPPNHWYGFRTPYTLSSASVWYHADRLTGAALAVSGVCWALLLWFVPRMDFKNPRAVTVWSGMGVLAISVVASFLLVYRKRR